MFLRNPFLERWAMHFTAESNQIGPSEVTMDDNLLGAVRHVAKHLTSHVSLSGGRVEWTGAGGIGHHMICFHVVLSWKGTQPHCHS